MATAHAHWLTVLAPDKTLYLTDGIKGVKQNRLSQQPEGKGYIHPDSRYYCCTCLLYTSDAADDLLCVDLGGRRLIKKKNK